MSHVKTRETFYDKTLTKLENAGKCDHFFVSTETQKYTTTDDHEHNTTTHTVTDQTGIGWGVRSTN